MLALCFGVVGPASAVLSLIPVAVVQGWYYQLPAVFMLLLIVFYTLGFVPAVLTGLVYGLAPTGWRSVYLGAGLGGLISTSFFFATANTDLMDVIELLDSRKAIALFMWTGTWTGFVCAALALRAESRA